MVTDKNGNELKVGDEVFVRGKIVAVPVDFQQGNASILQVNWTSGTPWLDYVDSTVVEKVESN